MAGRNIHGRIIADRLREFSPLVINEVGTARAEALQNWLVPNTYGPRLAATHDVPHFAGPESKALLAECDFAINGGCGILKSSMLCIPNRGWLNGHPGLLPEYRGANPVQWALANDGDVGATLHLMDEGIDTGPILIRQVMQWRGASTVDELRLHVIELCADLIATFLRRPEVYPPVAQVGGGEPYPVFPADRLGILPLKLAQYAARQNRSERPADSTAVTARGPIQEKSA